MNDRTEPETPAAPRPGCDIDGSETLTDWALRLANERVSGIIEPHELAHARHRRDELAAALAARPAEAQAGVGINAGRITVWELGEALHAAGVGCDPSTCPVTSATYIGIRRTMHDTDARDILARLASLPTEPEAEH